MQIIENSKVKEKLYIEKLENGLTIMIIPKKGIQKKYIMWATNYGSLDNNDGTLNTSTKAVYFHTEEISISESNDDFGYWYTNGTEIKDTSGNATDKYNPYTLYKWTSYDTVDDDGESTTEYDWLPVATLEGSSQSRMMSQIKQTANSIESSVTSLRGDYAGTKTQVDKNKSSIESLTKWKNGEEESTAIISQKADKDGASIVISTLTKKNDGVESSASLVLKANDETNSLSIDADNINFTATADYNVLAQNINLTGNTEFASLQTKVGNTIKSTTIEYALSNSSSTAPTSGWSTTAPAWAEGKYMWQKTTISYTDTTKANTVTTTCIQGAAGSTGKSVSSVTEYYLLSDQSTGITTSTTGWSTTLSSPTESKPYLWNYEVSKYSENTKASTNGTHT